MAHTNFLIIVLGIVIAGIAVMLGISAYHDNRQKASLDFLVNDAHEVAVDAQRWMRKPEFFGGGGDNCATSGCDWSGASLNALGYRDEDGAYHTHFGIIELDGTTDPANLVIVGQSNETEDKVVVRVSGVHRDSIHTELDRGSSQ